MSSVAEAVFQKHVLELAKICGWTAAHFRPAMTKHGWRTPVSADGKGFPDLVLVRDRVLYRELKRDGSRQTPEQVGWQLALEAAGADYAVWHPSDWPTIEATLTRRRGA